MFTLFASFGQGFMQGLGRAIADAMLPGLETAVYSFCILWWLAWLTFGTWLKMRLTRSAASPGANGPGAAVGLVLSGVLFSLLFANPNTVVGFMVAIDGLEGPVWQQYVFFALVSLFVFLVGPLILDGLLLRPEWSWRPIRWLSWLPPHRAWVTASLAAALLCFAVAALAFYLSVALIR